MEKLKLQKDPFTKMFLPSTGGFILCTEDGRYIPSVVININDDLYCSVVWNNPKIYCHKSITKKIVEELEKIRKNQDIQYIECIDFPHPEIPNLNIIELVWKREYILEDFFGEADDKIVEYMESS